MNGKCLAMAIVVLVTASTAACAGKQQEAGEEALTTQQVASNVAKIRSEIETTNDNVERCMHPAVLVNDSSCPYTVEAAWEAGKNASRSLHELSNPPHEVASLVRDTARAVDEIAAVRGVTKCRDAGEDFSVKCLEPAFDLTMAGKKARIALAGWEPYL